MKILRTLVRRLAEPVLLLLVAGGLILWYRAAGPSARWIREDYLSVAVGLAVLFFAVRLLNFLLFDLVFPCAAGPPLRPCCGSFPARF